MLHRILWLLLLGSVAGFALVAMTPELFSYSRLLLTGLLGLAVVSVLLLLWVWKIIRFVVLVLAVILVIAALAVGAWWVEVRGPSEEAYIKALQSHVGVPYVWGGEGWNGVDCSGLLRRAYVRASLADGLAHARPGCLKSAADVWLFDASAAELRRGYGGRTRVVESGVTINRLDHRQVAPGTLAITSNGIHCLAYLGNSTWIEADPNQMSVITHKAPDSNFGWFTIHVDLIRWTTMAN